MIKEKWKDIKGFEGKYRINIAGLIYSLISDKLLKPKLNKYGYLCVVLFNKKSYYFTVHRLVALNFIDNPSNLPQINHKDGNKQNNYYENLEWCTNQENITHAWNTGLSKPIKHSQDFKNKISIRQQGINNVMSNLNYDDIINLRIDFKNGMKRKQIANKYNISLRSVFRIANKEYYSNII